MGNNRFAVVNGNATLARSCPPTPRVTVSRLMGSSAGEYQVVFDSDVRGCAYVATIGETGTAVPTSGEIVVSSDPNNVNGVIVRTRNSAGAILVDLPFHLAVHCCGDDGDDD